MKFWRSENPRLERKHRILTRAVYALLILYLAFSIALAVLTRDQLMGGWFILGVMGLLGLVYVPMLLAAAQFIRWRITAKHGADVPDRALDTALSITSFVSGMIAFALFLLNTLVDFNFAYPWDNLRISGQITGFMLIALSVSLGALLLNYVLQWILRSAEKKGEGTQKAVTTKGLRIVAAVSLSVILVGALLIPFDRGTYNDGGSRYYKAALYEVILWDRGYAEDAMALPEDFDPHERQHTRVYLFPFTCYDFNAKWDMKH